MDSPNDDLIATLNAVLGISIGSFAFLSCSRSIVSFSIVFQIPRCLTICSLPMTIFQTGFGRISIGVRVKPIIPYVGVAMPRPQQKPNKPSLRMGIRAIQEVRTVLPSIFRYSHWLSNVSFDSVDIKYITPLEAELANQFGMTQCTSEEWVRPSRRNLTPVQMPMEEEAGVSRKRSHESSEDGDVFYVRARLPYARSSDGESDYEELLSPPSETEFDHIRDRSSLEDDQASLDAESHHDENSCKSPTQLGLFTFICCFNFLTHPQIFNFLRGFLLGYLLSGR